MAERPQPEVEREKAEDDGEAEERVTGAGRELDAAQLRLTHQCGDARQGRPETEQRPDARRVAGHVKAAPPKNEGDEQEQRDRRLLEVEAFREVRGGGGDDDRDRELPGAPPAPRKRAREPDQAEPEGDREDSRRLGPSRWQGALDDLDPVRHLRRQRRDDPENPDAGGAPREEPLGTGQP